MDAVEALAPGVIAEITAQPSVALTIRLTRHEGAVLQRRSTEAIVSARGPETRWIALYDRSVLATGWEPLDQPLAAAYLPLRFSQLYRMDCDSEYTLYWQMVPRRDVLTRSFRFGKYRFIHCAESMDQLRTWMLENLEIASVPAPVQRACGEKVIDCCRGWLPAAAPSPLPPHASPIRYLQ